MCQIVLLRLGILKRKRGGEMVPTYFRYIDILMPFFSAQFVLGALASHHFCSDKIKVEWHFLSSSQL